MHVRRRSSGGGGGATGAAGAAGLTGAAGSGAAGSGAAGSAATCVGIDRRSRREIKKLTPWSCTPTVVSSNSLKNI